MLLIFCFDSPIYYSKLSPDSLFCMQVYGQPSIKLRTAGAEDGPNDMVHKAPRYCKLTRLELGDYASAY
jgi:hypothetical protein